MDDQYDDEPTTRLSSAFFVVLILHVVAVAGIYAFNSIKAHRRGVELPGLTASATADARATDGGASAPPPEPARTNETRTLTSASASATAPEHASAPTSNANVYHVKPGDNLTKIAAALGISVAELQLANSPKETATLRQGQILNIPARRVSERAPAAPTPAAVFPKKPVEAGTKTYTVQKGDTVTSIARKAGITTDELLKLNKIGDPKKLQLGASLKLPSRK